jgi:hypothetical protein
VRIVREAGRLVAIVEGERRAAPSRAGRTAATVAASYVRAPAGPAEDVVFVAPSERRRPTQWAGERHRVEEATAYRGAFRAEFAGAQTFTTPDSPFEAARVSRTPARRERPRRIAATAGEMSLAAPQVSAANVPVTEAAPGARRAAARRPGLEDRLRGVAEGEPGAAAPGWAARSDGTPFVRSPGGLFEALARASTAEEIVRVIYARAEGVRETPLAQEAPVVQVIEQIRQEVRREQVATEQATRQSRLDAPSATVIRGQYVQAVPSTTRVRSGNARGLTATARTVSAGSGDDRITKLVKKLQGLIHLAEAEGRLAEAQRQVRMAEDSPGARAEGQGPAGATKEGGDKQEKQDIEALGREVLEVVTRELEFRRMRRLEDHDESSWW